ncbi:MAG TPA: carboxypeptidase-like regulatory domain-containing protein, partial [Gemmatimonadaceae bacterium]
MFRFFPRPVSTFAAGLLIVGMLSFRSHTARAEPVDRGVRSADISGTVTDSANGRPLPSAEVSVMQGAQVIFNATTDAFGRYTAHN